MEPGIDQILETRQPEKKRYVDIVGINLNSTIQVEKKRCLETA